MTRTSARVRSAIADALSRHHVYATEAAHQRVVDEIVAAVEASQPDHLIHVNPDTRVVTVLHSMACRLAGQVLDCRYMQVASQYTGPAAPGLYRCTLDSAGRLVIGEQVPA